MEGKKDDKCYLIPIVFHNLKGYDSHIIIKHLTKFYAPNDANVIAMNLEKYLSFEIRWFEIRWLSSVPQLWIGCTDKEFGERG